MIYLADGKFRVEIYELVCYNHKELKINISQFESLLTLNKTTVK